MVQKDELAALEWVMQVRSLPLLAGLHTDRLLCLMVCMDAPWLLLHDCQQRSD